MTKERLLIFEKSAVLLVSKISCISIEVAAIIASGSLHRLVLRISIAFKIIGSSKRCTMVLAIKLFRISKCVGVAPGHANNSIRVITDISIMYSSTSATQEAGNRH